MILNKENIEKFCEDEFFDSDMIEWLTNTIDRFGEINVSTDDIITADNKEGKMLKVEIQFSEIQIYNAKTPTKR